MIHDVRACVFELSMSLLILYDGKLFAQRLHIIMLHPTLQIYEPRTAPGERLVARHGREVGCICLQGKESTCRIWGYIIPMEGWRWWLLLGKVL